MSNKLRPTLILPTYARKSDRSPSKLIALELRKPLYTSTHPEQQSIPEFGREKLPRQLPAPARLAINNKLSVPRRSVTGAPAVALEGVARPS